MQNVHTLLKLAQIRWTDHVTRMPDERLPKKEIILWRTSGGKSLPGWREETLQNTIKASLKDFNIPPEQFVLGTDITGSAKWRCLVRNGADVHEAKSI